ncbi:MAG: toprim domain-containing protein, partial [Desulfovibrio sp.]|nr:toprim domain-containing protein [Desulfovibrio sp.]
MSDLLQTFQEVLGTHGLVPEEILADGELHRCPTDNKPHKRNGAYIAHLDAPATLWWCNWETDDQGTFCAEEKPTLSPAELSAWQQRQQVLRRQREEESAKRHAEAAQRARQEWEAAHTCDSEHPYLLRKGITPLPGIRQSKDGALLVPVLDAASKLQSLQRIYPDGTKRFLVGGKVQGGRFTIPGSQGRPIAICEGLATGASIHMAMGWAVDVAFSAHNLSTIARMVKERFPDRALLICGDADEAGHKKGVEAARTTNLPLV